MRRRRSPSLSKQNLFQKDNKNVDYPLLVSVIILVTFGLVMVYDSSVVQAFRDYNDKYFYIRQQLIWVFLGFGAMFFFSKFNHERLKPMAFPVLIVSFVLLFAVFVPGLGLNAGGAHRWLRFGFFSLQPAEIIKLSSIIYFANIFEKRVTLMPFLGVVSFVCFIVGLLQKDLGSTIVYFFISVSMFWVAGGAAKYFFYFLPVSILSMLVFILSSTYRKHRLLAFLDPFADPQGYSYHISQVLIALGSGGLLGLGIGQSRQKFEYIPEVTTDSIFSIVGEEFGFVGSVFLIFLLSFVIYRGLKIAERCPDKFGRLLALGLTIWLGAQAIINLAAMVALIPLTGVPLPFISYGGSALLVNLIAVGILLNISKESSSS